MPPKKTTKSTVTAKSVEALKHVEATRKNIPSAEHQSVMEEAQKNPVRVAYERRNRDLDPQLVWRGKDEQDWSDLVVQAPPLYIQEKIHPKVLIDDLRRQTEQQAASASGAQFDLFADFNGLPDTAAKTEFYQHDAHWSNRMILGDSLQVMASLAEREGMRGKVQCIYFDPPYGIKFNSNFQWSTTDRNPKDGNTDHITREPEQVKAFRDTWRDGIHSYLTYLRDRLTVARDLLTDSGSIFVQIGDENVHRIRTLMDEVFGDENCISQITFAKTSGLVTNLLPSSCDLILWFAKNRTQIKYRQIFLDRPPIENPTERYICVQTEKGEIIDLSLAQKLGDEPIPAGKFLKLSDVTSQDPVDGLRFTIDLEGRSFRPSERRHWATNAVGMKRIIGADRLHPRGNNLWYKRFNADFPSRPLGDVWLDVKTNAFGDPRYYVVQTGTSVVQRCILMATDPGDLVLDPTCGSGTSAYVAEQWGRRWITIDTSRVALALARARIMGARYPYYLLADSSEGQQKEAEVTRSAPSTALTRGNIRHGFVYERVPHVTLKSIANNSEIDVIWEKWQQTLEPIRAELNALLGTSWEEWEIPRSFGFRTKRAEGSVSRAVDGAEVERIAKLLSAEQLKRLRANDEKAESVLESWWAARIGRQKEIDASIAAKAESEYLYDKPYEDKKKVRVAGPFTVESLSPHRVLGVGEDDELIDHAAEGADGYGEGKNFATMILENLRTAGVQQAHKEDKIAFTSLVPWPGSYVCAEGRYHEGDAETGPEKRAAVFIGPEFGTVSRIDLVEAAKEAGDAGFDVLIACAFNFDAHSSEFNKLGRIPVLKARMNADLHMADTLKNTGKGNLFVIFGEPDIEILDAGTEGTEGQIRVQVNGVDVFHPQTGEVRSDGPDGIACWFLDTDYNGESFFVRHAYFLGANDPYKSLKTTLKAEINEDAWATLHSAVSRPFDTPIGGRIAVKVINHLGDEVMKVFRVK